MSTPIYFYKAKNLSNLKADSIVAVKNDNESAFSLFVTDKTGIPYPLKDLQNNVIITNTDGNLQITSSSTSTNINLASSVLATINSALQSGDNISELVNDSGYLTTFTETDPIFQASEASLFVSGDKANLDNQSGINSGNQTSIVGISGTKSQFNTQLTDGDFLFAGDIISYTNEEAQDAIGNILTDSTTIDFTYDDTTPTISANVKLNSIDATHLSSTINNSEFVNDSNYTNKTYVDSLVVGLLDDRGSYDASVNTFPTIGGSGTAGTILKGDIWYVSVAGILAGQTVNIGDNFRALVDSPAQVSTNWSILEANIGYVPENVANKSTNTSLGTSNVLYPTQNAVKTYVDSNPNGYITDVNLSYTPSAINGTVVNDRGTDATISIVDFTNAGLLTPEEKQLLYNNSATGVTKFEGFSINADTTKYNTGLIEGWFVDNTTNPNIPTKVFKSFPATTGNTLTNIATQNVTYIAVDINGVHQQSGVPFEPELQRDWTPLGVIVHSNRININAINNQPVVALSPNNQLSDLMESISVFNIYGNIFAPNGVNLNINKSAGQIFKQGSNFITNTKDPHTTLLPALIAPSNIRYRTQLGAESADTNLIAPNFWDNAGVITAMTGTRWSIQRIYLFQSNLVRIQYGQATYTTQAEAIQAITTEAFVVEQNILENGLFRALLIVREGATDLTDINRALFIEASKFGSVAGLGSLSTTNLQQAYNNSLTPEITTNSTLGAVSIRRGSTADTDNVLEIENGAGVITATIKGNGGLTALNYNGYIPEDITNKQNSLTVDGTGIKYPTVDAVNTGLALKANIASPTFTGVPSVPTATAGTNTTQAASTAFVTNADSGNVKLTGDQTISGTKTISGNLALQGRTWLVNSFPNTLATGSSFSDTNIGLNGNKFAFANQSTGIATLNPTNAATTKVDFSLPSSGGTIALTSNPTSITATSFIKSGATSTNILLAGGSDIPQSTFATPSNSIQNQNASAQSANMWINGEIKSVKSAIGWAGWFENQTGSGVVITAGDNSAGTSLLVRKKDGTETFSVQGTGAATFSSSVTANQIIANPSSGIPTDNGTFFNTTANNYSYLQGGSSGLLIYSSGNRSIGANIELNNVDGKTIFTNNGATFSSSVTATSHVTSGGSATQFVKGDGSLSTGYKVYTALLTQTGTSAPVATVLDNTLGGTVVWTRSGTGSYIGTLSGAFTNLKTWTIIGGNYNTPSSFLRLNRVDSNSVSIVTESGGISDNVLENTSIEIRVYN